MKQITKFLFSLILSCTLSVASVQGFPVFAEENTDIPETVLPEEIIEETSQNTNPESGSLLQENENIGDLKKYLMEINNLVNKKPK